MSAGLIDTRPVGQREATGTIPGAVLNLVTLPSQESTRRPGY